jgi:hypothetical protein
MAEPIIEMEEEEKQPGDFFRKPMPQDFKATGKFMADDFMKRPCSQKD